MENDFQKRLSRLEENVKHIDKSVEIIRLQVINHLPTEIKLIRQDLQEYKLKQMCWLVGILTALVINIFLTLF